MAEPWSLNRHAVEGVIRVNIATQGGDPALLDL
jgi:hypothetical protein